MADQEISRKLAVILHADVAGSTTLVQRDETLAHKRINEAFQRFSSIIQEYKGAVHEIRGDALVAEFARASDAVCAALHFQQANTDHNAQLSDDIVPVVRIGIALGEEVFADDTVTGAGVVLAQRVEQLSEAGGVCVTGAIHEAIPQRLPFDQESLGEQEVKGFEEPVRVYRVALKPGELIPPPEKSKPAQSSSQTRRLIVAFAALALVVIGGLVVWLQPWAPEFEPASVERMAFPLPDKPSIAVLPFDNLSADPEQEYFSDGLTNDIITDLSKFKHLFVIASKSTFAYKNKPVKVQTVSEELGVRYVLEGSFQKANERLRINAQLIDATTGHHLWAERYDRNAADFFAIQEDILRTIVGSLASQVTEAELTRAVGKGTEDLRAYDYYQRGRRVHRRFTKEANNQARELLERAIELDPDYARAYGYLTWIHVNNRRYRWGEDPERSLDLALEVARKAVALDPDDYRSHWVLGFAYLHHGDFDRALAEYERALALNRNDATVLVEMAELLVKIGRAEQAVAQVKTGMRINPHHPEWYFWNLGWAQYFTGQYEEALTTLNRMSNPPNGVRRTLAAVLVRLGRLEEARAVMAKFIETDLDMTLAEMEARAWKDREFLHRWIDDLRTAGLPERRPLPLPDKPSIAVLPFTNMSEDPKQEYFVDGMTEDLITDLSKISGLFVIARNSVFTYKGRPVKVRQVAEELGVRYVLEGSVRRADSQVRINAQLIDATTGGHVWAERYDGALANVFAMQDKVTQQIVTALTVNLTFGEKAKQARAETDNPYAYDAFLRGWQHYQRHTPEHYAKAREYFEQAIDLDPSYSRAFAALASIYWKGRLWYPALKLDRQTVKSRAKEYLETAMQNPTPLAHQVAAYMRLHRGRWEAALVEAERAIALDPNDVDGHVALANVLIFVGRPQEALDSIKYARRLDPHDEAQHSYLSGLAEFGLEQFDAAAASLERAIELNPELLSFSGDFGATWCAPCTPLAAAYGYLGRMQDAQMLIQKFKQQYSGWNVNHAVYPWFFKEAADRNRLAEGLVKAGAPE